MPLYEYLCDACGHKFEKIQKFSDPLVETCPQCGGAVHKLMSSPAIQFKGSGFYITDYPKQEHVTAAKADSDSATSDKTAASAKSEKSEKPEKSEKSEKSDTSEKSEKSEKAAKSDRGEGSSRKVDKGSSSSNSASPGASTASPSVSSTKDSPKTGT
jgi:putative FmdB family regulatory protein